MDATTNVAYMGLQEYMLPCMNKKIFGVDCPGCGLQRSIALLLKGDFIAAFEMYPAIYPLLLFLAFLAANYFFKFNYAGGIKIFLGLLTGATIFISYIIKMNFIFN